MSLLTFRPACPISFDDLQVLTYGRVLDNLRPDFVTDSISRLRSISHEAAWVSLEILSMYCFQDDEKWNACRQAFIELLPMLPLDFQFQRRGLEHRHWSTAAKKLLNQENPEFAEELTKQILCSLGVRAVHVNLSHDIKPVLRLLLKNNGKHVWPIFSKAIKEADSVKRYHLEELLSEESSFESKQTSVLADLPEKILHEWCRSEPDTAPLFVARSTDVYIEENDEFRISARAQFLVDEFGNSVKVLDALTANMHSFRCWGSAVPIYKKQATVLEPLLKHNLPTVQNWAEKNIERLNKYIKQETQRDEELTWGIMS